MSGDLPPHIQALVDKAAKKIDKLLKKNTALLEEQATAVRTIADLEKENATLRRDRAALAQEKAALERDVERLQRAGEPKRKRAPAKPASAKPASAKRAAAPAASDGGGKRAAPGGAAAASDGGGKRARSLAVAGAKAAAPAALPALAMDAALDDEFDDLLGSSDDDDAPGAGAGLNKAAADAAARRGAASALHIVDPARGIGSIASELDRRRALRGEGAEGDRSMTDEQRFDCPTPPPLELDLGAAPRDAAAAPAAAAAAAAETLKVAVWVALGRDRAAALKDTGHRLALKDARLYARHVLARDAVAAADLGLLAPKTKLWQKRWEAKKVAGRKRAPRTDEERKLKQRRDNADDLSDGVHSWAADDVVLEVAARARGGGDADALARVLADLGRVGFANADLAAPLAAAALSWEGYVAGLSASRRQALAAAEERWGTAPDAAAPLALALAFFALGGGGDADALRREADRRAAAPDVAALRKGVENADAAAAWALARVDPGDATLAAARAAAAEALARWPGDAHAAAKAAFVLAASDGEAAAGDAALAWARTLPDATRLDRRLLVALDAARRRPRATFVNLDASADRRAAMRRLGLVHGVALERFAARTPADVDAADVATHWGEDAALLNEFYDDQTRGDQKKASLLRETLKAGRPAELSPTERACAASHVALWRRCRDGGAPLVVLEDDVVFCDGFAERLRATVERTPMDADLALLGYFFREEKAMLDVPLQTLEAFLVPKYFWGLHAYWLSPGGAAKLLRRLPVDCPVDVFVARGLHDDALVGYAAKHKLAKQRTADTSTVEHTRRENSGVVHNPKKVIDFDLAADAAARVC